MFNECLSWMNRCESNSSDSPKMTRQHPAMSLQIYQKSKKKNIKATKE